MKLRPGKPLIWLFFLSGILLALEKIVQQFAAYDTGLIQQFSGAALLALIFVSAFDLWRLWKMGPPEFERQLPSHLSLDRKAEVALQVKSDRAETLEVFDCRPEHSAYTVMPISVAVQANEKHRIVYQIRPKQRGLLKYSSVLCRRNSAFKLWQKTLSIKLESEAKVYPDFAQILGKSLLNCASNRNSVGLRHYKKRGMGLDFHQLREYRIGDPFRQIDWNTTARRQTLISKEFQDERDQQVIFMLDNGKQMLAMEDGLSHFDHALNSVLMLSYLALRQGDAVSMMSFADEFRWLPPIKGVTRINALLNRFYDLNPKPVASDFLGAAEEIVNRHRKRSLVVLLTNLRDDNVDSVRQSARLLSKHHLVVVLNLIEPDVAKTAELEIQSFDSALLWSAIQHYGDQRRKANRTLAAQCFMSLDTKVGELSQVLSDTYASLKASGRF